MRLSVIGHQHHRERSKKICTARVIARAPRFAKWSQLLVEWVDRALS